MKRLFKFNTSKPYYIFIILISLRFLIGIFNLSFTIDLLNNMFNYIFTIFVLYILLCFRECKINKDIIFMRYITPIIIVITSFLFTNVSPIIIPYVLYFIISIILLPLFKFKKYSYNIIRLLLICTLFIILAFISTIYIIFKDIGSTYIKEEFIFLNNENKKLMVIAHDEGALGGSTELIYQEKIHNTIFKCEKTLSYGSWNKKYSLNLIYNDINKSKIWFCAINKKIK